MTEQEFEKIQTELMLKLKFMDTSIEGIKESEEYKLSQEYNKGIRASIKTLKKHVVSEEEYVPTKKEQIRACLDNIYKVCDSLPENFGNEILEELETRFEEDGYEITEKSVLEEMLWCYMLRMQ
jgi:hypothetical protein